MIVHPWQALKLVFETMPLQNGKDKDVQAFFSECYLCHSGDLKAKQAGSVGWPGQESNRKHSRMNSVPFVIPSAMCKHLHEFVSKYIYMIHII